MKENSNAPDTSYKGTLTFIDHHIPALEDGTYTVTVDQTANSEASIQASKELVVSGPRFALPADLIHSHFPPKSGVGVYDGVVPAISFSRNTLPWERSPDKAASSRSDGTSWLALVLVDEKDIANGNAKEVYQVSATSTSFPLKDVKGYLGIPDLDQWPLYNPDMPVNILELKNDFYQALLPTYGDLQWLSHCRQNRSGDTLLDLSNPAEQFENLEEDALQGEMTYVLGSRLPTPGKLNTVYLVSLEQRYANNNPDTKPTLISRGTQKLVWLYKWQFFCKSAELTSYTVTPAILKEAKKKFPIPPIHIPENLPYWVGQEYIGAAGKEQLEALLLANDSGLGPITPEAAAFILNKSKKNSTFRHILEKVDSGNLQDNPLPGKTISNETAGKLLATGRTVLSHHLRSGGKTYSWFKGPLSAVPETDKGFNFPVNTADDLLIFDQETGMFDTTYAAAWALGRLKGVEDKVLSTTLFRWRHQQRHATQAQNHLLHFSHLPQPLPATKGFPDTITKKLDKWKLLKSLPFDYLVPKPDLLPSESLRFFHLDTNWLRAFIDGFFSVGKVNGFDDQQEEFKHFPSFDKPITGILLRSEAVAGWPAMHINASAIKLDGTDYDPNDYGKMVSILRKAFLQKEVMLVLFDGVPKTLDFYLSPEGLHSGFEVDQDDPPEYSHIIRDPKTGEELTGKVEAISSNQGNQQYRTFNATALSMSFQTEIIKKYADFQITPGYFGLELIEGAPMVRIQVE